MLNVFGAPLSKHVNGEKEEQSNVGNAWYASGNL